MRHCNSNNNKDNKRSDENSHIPLFTLRIFVRRDIGNCDQRGHPGDTCKRSRTTNTAIECFGQSYDSQRESESAPDHIRRPVQEVFPFTFLLFIVRDPFIGLKFFRAELLRGDKGYLTNLDGSLINLQESHRQICHYFGYS